MDGSVIVCAWVFGAMAYLGVGAFFASLIDERSAEKLEPDVWLFTIIVWPAFIAYSACWGIHKLLGGDSTKRGSGK